MAKFALACSRLFDGEQLLSDHAVVVDRTHIVECLPTASLPSSLVVQEISGTLAPGFIDLQVNGGGGELFNNNPSVDCLARMATAHRSKGSTALLPTLMTDTSEVQQRALAALSEVQISKALPGIIGAHFEGPCFNAEKRGVHRADYLRSLDAELVQWLEAQQNFTRVLTLAPEVCEREILRSLSSSGVIVCAGHSNATFEQIQQAIDDGVRGFTHLFNAMSPLTSREPGVVGAVLDSATTWAGIIADGIHVHPASIRIAHRALAPDRLVLVSDAMATIAADSPSFELYGETITCRDGKLVNSNGNIAGSAIGMIDAVAYCANSVGLPLSECLKMASLYPARCIGRDQEFGRLQPGFRADFVHFDDQFQVRDTWVAGQHLSH